MRLLKITCWMAMLSVTSLLPYGNADVIHLKSGTKVVGKIEDPKAALLVIKTLYSKQSYTRAQVDRIELGPTPWDEFDGRLAKLGKKDLDGLVDLLDWANEDGRKSYLGSKLKRLYRMILRLDKNNDAARKGLGYVKIAGEWVSRAELKRRNKAGLDKKAAEDQRAQAERDKLARLKRAEGDVGLQMEMNKGRDKGDEEKLTEAIATPMVVATSKRISIGASFERDGLKSLLELGEKALTEVGRDLGVGPKYNPGRSGARSVYHHYFAPLVNRRAMIDYIASTSGGISKAFYVFLMRGKSGLAANSSRPVAYTIERKGVNRKDSILHNLGHCMAGSFSGSGNLAPWLSEGYGMYMSIRFLGNTGHFCSTHSKYAHQLKVAKKSDEAGWKLIVREQVTKKVYPRFRSLCIKKLNVLDAKDLARSWIICKFLMDKSPKKFKSFMSYTGIKIKSQARALKASLEWDLEQLDENLNKWILSEFK